LGAIYKHVNSRLTHRSEIAPLLNKLGGLVADDAGKADLLNRHFVGVGCVDDGNLPPLGPNNAPLAHLDTVYFSRSDIVCILSALDIISSSGPDGIPPLLLKSLRHQLANLLAAMFNLLFKFGSIPDPWKTVTVKPLFKKGSSSDPNKYRPISLTSVL